MKKSYLLTILSLFAFAINVISSETITLKNGWQFKQSTSEKWLPAVVPGSVQQNLLIQHLIPDPYYGTNEQKIGWIENENWDYKLDFTLNKSQKNFENIDLLFNGLDTYCDVFLNGAKLFSAQNMFTAYSSKVKNLIREGKNSLYIRFYSPINFPMPKRVTTGFEYPADNDHRAERMSVYSRKAPYHFGWDWGMRMVQMGVWRPVELVLYNGAKIEDYYVEQLSLGDEIAETSHQLEIYSNRDSKARIYIKYSDPETNKQYDTSQEFHLKKGENSIKIPLKIEKPKRWMPINWGKQHLYNFAATIEIDGKVVDRDFRNIGLRSVKLVQNEEKVGRTFYFEVNGKPFFAKGANYIPGEIINTLQDSTYYEKLFENIVAANMNMIRVWGGGFYEDNYFYHLADKYGVLIWQDFMFACTTYPSDDEYLNEVKREVKYNVKRLRNHPSLALWCGNNEISEALKYWGWDSKYSAETMKEFREGYAKTFKKTIPEILKSLDAHRDYVHTSPDTANWGRRETMPMGDAHYWGVWYGREPFEVLDSVVPRFMSEFGFQAFPEMKTIRTFAKDSDLNIDSEVMKSHQKSTTGNDAILDYMKRYYRVPQDFENFVYVGNVMQGMGMRHGMEAHRRNRPYCMGSLYWQLNDSWPVVSWAGIDYYGNWKSLHYQAREAFKPLTIEIFETENKLQFYSISDLLEDRKNCKIKVEIVRFDGKIERIFNKKIDMKANSTHLLFSIDTENLLPKMWRKNHLLKATLLDSKNDEIATIFKYFAFPKELNLPKVEIKSSLSTKNGKNILTLSTNGLAKDIFVEVNVQGAKFSDNFFDLLPHTTKSVEIICPNGEKLNLNDIKIKHLRDSYQ